MSQESHHLLREKRGIIFGPLNEQSLAWQISLACHREGARLALSNTKMAFRFGPIRQLAEICGDAPLIVCDASSSQDLEKAFQELKSTLGKVDFIVHSIGMSPNVRKQRSYDDLNYDWFHKTLDVSALSLHRIVVEALKSDSLNDGGSIVALTYIGAQRIFSRYSDMGDAKALLESVARSFGYRLGRRGSGSTPCPRVRPAPPPGAGSRDSTAFTRRRTGCPPWATPRPRTAPISWWRWFRT